MAPRGKRGKETSGGRRGDASAALLEAGRGGSLAPPTRGSAPATRGGSRPSKREEVSAGHQVASPDAACPADDPSAKPSSGSGFASSVADWFQAVQWKQVGLLLGLFVIINLLWDTQVIFPIKLLVVFLHESSHGITAYLTGGKVEHLEVSPAEGGVCYTVGGNRFLILSAGYLGSLLWGGLILNLASRTRYDRHVSIALGVTIVLVSLIFVRPFFSFGQIFTLIAGGLLLFMGCDMPELINDVLLRIIGLTSCLYATLDIKSDIIDRSGIRSDARMLSELTGLPTLFYGFTWITVAVVAAIFMVIEASKPQAQSGDPNIYLPTPAFELPTFRPSSPEQATAPGV